MKEIIDATPKPADKNIMEMIRKQSTAPWYEHTEEIEAVMSAPHRSNTELCLEMFWQD